MKMTPCTDSKLLTASITEIGPVVVSVNVYVSLAVNLSDGPGFKAIVSVEDIIRVYVILKIGIRVKVKELE